MRLSRIQLFIIIFTVSKQTDIYLRRCQRIIFQHFNESLSCITLPVTSSVQHFKQNLSHLLFVVRNLSTIGITQLFRYYEAIRLPIVLLTFFCFAEQRSPLKSRSYAAKQQVADCCINSNSVSFFSYFLSETILYRPNTARYIPAATIICI